uniref:Uncharacterized protein n=1 Tax=Arundo donax TaxID=35708 RepID=A0A0A9F6J0_ARUDO
MGWSTSNAFDVKRAQHQTHSLLYSLDLKKLNRYNNIANQQIPKALYHCKYYSVGKYHWCIIDMWTQGQFSASYAIVFSYLGIFAMVLS